MDCKIRKWDFSDAKDLSITLSNIKIQENLRDGLPYPYTERDGVEFISAMRSADPNDTFAFAITVDDKAVGSISAFRQGNIHRKTAELGYYLAEEYWGKGIMTEAVRQLCDYVSPIPISSASLRNPLLIISVPAVSLKKQDSSMKARSAAMR